MQQSHQFAFDPFSDACKFALPTLHSLPDVRRNARFRLHPDENKLVFQCHAAMPPSKALCPAGRCGTMPADCVPTHRMHAVDDTAESPVTAASLETDETKSNDMLPMLQQHTEP